MYRHHSDILEDGTVATDLTITRRVVKAKSVIFPDRLIDGPGGVGWASASFDQPRRGRHTWTLENGEEHSMQISNCDYDQNYPEVGDLYTKCLVRFERGDPGPSNDIPF